jgi:hypothetical protein
MRRCNMDSSPDDKSQGGGEDFTRGRNRFARDSFLRGRDRRRVSMRSILLWVIGIPLPIILLLALCTHHF